MRPMAEIAMAASAREWPDRLHRFLLDHGGGRIVDSLMSADQAMDAEFDVLLIDDVCSFLSPHLVTVLKRSGAEIVGVFAPEDGSDAKRRLLECGISDVIETGASPEEFLAKVSETLEHRIPIAEHAPVSTSTLSIAVTGPCEGVGMTEVALALACSLSAYLEAVLVDMDPVWPSVAQRLDLAVHPNIRTAIDHAIHSPERLSEALHQVDGLKVVGGRADGGQSSPVSRHESVALFDALGSVVEVAVADLGPLRHVDGGLVREFDTVLVVGTGGPVGVARLTRTVGEVLAVHGSQSVLAVVNRPGPGAFRESETLRELQAVHATLPIVMLPFDSKLSDAAWDGELTMGRAFTRSVDAIADVVVRSRR